MMTVTVWDDVQLAKHWRDRPVNIILFDSSSGSSQVLQGNCRTPKRVIPSTKRSRDK